jgi:hypothetical protein
VDDINGRLIGEKIGQQAFDYASSYFERNTVLSSEKPVEIKTTLYPNPIMQGELLRIQHSHLTQISQVKIVSVSGRVIYDMLFSDHSGNTFSISTENILPGFYVVHVHDENRSESHLICIY